MSDPTGAPALELLLVRAEDELRLASPAVGRFTRALPRGSVLVPGQEAGVLLALGRAHLLRVPAGASGVVADDPPERVTEPVGHGDVLYRLTPLAGAALVGEEPGADAGAAASGLVLRSPSAGRFWRRSGPESAPFVEAGSVLEEGKPVGLLEIMKTFGHVPYRATGGLPKRARVVRVLVEDGTEVDDGQPLLALEPA